MTDPTSNAQKPDTQVSKSPLPIKWVGYALGAIGAAFFATKGIVIKLAFIENVDVLTVLAWRMIIAVPFFAIIGGLGYRDRRRKDPNFSVPPVTVLKAAGTGMLGYYIASYLDFTGLFYISAQFERLLLLTYPFFVVFFGVIFFKRKISFQIIAALLVSYAGLALIFAQELTISGQNTIVGALFVLAAAMSFALYQLLAKPVIDQIGARLFTSIAMSAAGIAVVVHFVATHQFSDLSVSPNAMWMMLAIGTISTVFPAYLLSASIGIIGPEPTAMIGNVGPLVTIGMAITILGEVFTLWHALGAALVLIGIFAFSRAQKRLTQSG